MKLTRRGHYSVKAMLDLAMHPRGELASVRQIAQRQNIPAPYLEKLLIALRQAGLVDAVRGSQGGYRLKKLPKRILIGEILAAVGEDIPTLHSLQNQIEQNDQSDLPPKTPYTQQSKELPKNRHNARATNSYNKDSHKVIQQASDWVTLALWQRLDMKFREAIYNICLEDLYYDARSWQAAQREDNNFMI